MPSSSQVHDHQFISRQFLELDNLIIGKREERRGELVKKSIHMLTVFRYAHFFGRQQLLPYITEGE